MLLRFGAVVQQAAREAGKINQGQNMRHHTFALACMLLIVAGCSAITGDRVVVRGAGPTDLLKLRYGPSLGYKVKLGLPDGTELIRRNCVTEMGQLWCEVSLAASPDVTGYVSADYLGTP